MSNYQKAKARKDAAYRALSNAFKAYALYGYSDDCRRALIAAREYFVEARDAYRNEAAKGA